MNIQEIIKKYGVENVFVEIKSKKLHRCLFLTYTTSDEAKSKICHINEDRYKISEDYKITLAPDDKNFAKHHYYISDLNSIIDSGHVRVFISPNCEKHEAVNRDHVFDLKRAIMETKGENSSEFISYCSITNVKGYDEKDIFKYDITLKRPGIFIGKKGEAIKSIENNLEKIIKKKVHINLIEANTELDHLLTIYDTGLSYL